MSLVQFQLQQLRSLEVQAQEMEQLRREMDEITLLWGESFVIERGSERGGRGGGDSHHDHHHHHPRERERQHHDGGHNQQQQQHNKGRQQAQTQAQTQQRRRRQPHRNGAEGMTVTVENELAR